jgi:hypothetical protein
VSIARKKKKKKIIKFIYNKIPKKIPKIGQKWSKFHQITAKTLTMTHSIHIRRFHRPGAKAPPAASKTDRGQAPLPPCAKGKKQKKKTAPKRPILSDL